MRTKNELSIYARISSNRQGHASIHEQIRVCDNAARQAGSVVVAITCERKKQIRPSFSRGGRG